MVPEMTIGQYAVPFVLSIIMGLIYKFVPVITDRYKALLTVIIGVVLAVISMYYAGPETVTFQMWANSLIGGILIGAGAIGIYEVQRTVTRPRGVDEKGPAK